MVSGLWHRKYGDWTLMVSGLLCGETHEWCSHEYIDVKLSDPEVALRERFDWHLEHARQRVRTLPPFCIEAFEVLIQALHQKYPTFQVAA